MIRPVLIVLALVLFCGCVSNQGLGSLKLKEPTSPECAVLWKGVSRADPLAALDTLSVLAESRCDRETVLLGQKIRESSRDKTYSVTAEAAEFVVPAGWTVDYVLEGYERSYLGLLIARSYLRLNRIEDAQVELRRVEDDRKARIYNETKDSLIALLLAVLWEKTGDSANARASWRQVSETPGADEAFLRFAEEQVRRIDAGGKPPLWTVRAVGFFPEIDWKLGTGGENTHEVTAPDGFPGLCVAEGSLRAPADSWLRELNGRFSMRKMPLQTVRSNLRAAFGILVGATLIAGGVVVMIAGCSDSRDVSCRAAIDMGSQVMSWGVDSGKTLAKPDLRHWRRVPAAFLVSTEERGFESCASEPLAMRPWL